MSQPFLDLALVEVRIRIVVTAIKKVALAMDLASAELDIKNIPAAAYVLPTRDAPGNNTLANAVDQRVTGGFGVLLAVRNLADARGQKAGDALRPLRSSVCDALLNWTPGTYNAEQETWTPDQNYSPCEYAGGRIMKLNEATLWWLDEYRTSFYVRKTD